MSPSIAEPGALANDPKPDTPEHEQMVRRYKVAVARAAKLRQLEADLPQAIHDAELRVRDLAGRLGLPSEVAAAVRKPVRRTKMGERRRLTIEALATPGTAAQVAARMRTTSSVAGVALQALVREGLAEKSEGYRGVYSLKAPDASEVAEGRIGRCLAMSPPPHGGSWQRCTLIEGHERPHMAGDGLAAYTWPDGKPWGDPDGVGEDGL